MFIHVSSSSQAHLGHPQLQHLCLMFHATTARWLVLLATQESHDISTLSHDPEILFPLPKKVSLVPTVIAQTSLVHDGDVWFPIVDETQPCTAFRSFQTQHKYKYRILFAEKSQLLTFIRNTDGALLLQ